MPSVAKKDKWKEISNGAIFGFKIIIIMADKNNPDLAKYGLPNNILSRSRLPIIPARKIEAWAPTIKMKILIERRLKTTLHFKLRFNIKKITPKNRIKMVILNPDKTIICESPEALKLSISDFVKRDWSPKVVPLDKAATLLGATLSKTFTKFVFRFLKE